MSTIVAQLKATRLLRTAEECEQFEDALAEIDPASDLALLPELYEVFSDEAAVPALMWQLLHLIESFEQEARLRTLIEKTPFLREHAPDWLETFWARTLNSDAARIRLQ